MNNFELLIENIVDKVLLAVVVILLLAVGSFIVVALATVV